MWRLFNNTSSKLVEENNSTRRPTRICFKPVSVSKCSSFVALQFRETKGHVTETWLSTSAGICAPLFATMRSLTHQWVPTLYRWLRAKNTNLSLLNIPSLWSADSPVAIKPFEKGDVSNQSGLFQDNKAMNMFSMDHMLKDGWSGFYSQGFMYFDNCSSLFLPKVCDTFPCGRYQPNNRQ